MYAQAGAGSWRIQTRSRAAGMHQQRRRRLFRRRGSRRLRARPSAVNNDSRLVDQSGCSLIRAAHACSRHVVSINMGQVAYRVPSLRFVTEGNALRSRKRNIIMTEHHHHPTATMRTSIGDHEHHDWKHNGCGVIPANWLDANTAQTPGMDRKAAINFAPRRRAEDLGRHGLDPCQCQNRRAFTTGRRKRDLRAAPARRGCAGASIWNMSRAVPAISSTCPFTCRIRSSTPRPTRRSNACWWHPTTRRGGQSRHRASREARERGLDRPDP